MTAYDAVKAAEFLADAHRRRADFANLEGELAPPTIADAYDVQEALTAFWQPIHGKVAGLKIATTTKVMQELMGIDHPCGGMIYANRIHAAPARLKAANFIHPMVECELAVRLGQDLAGEGAPHTAKSVRAAVAEAMAAFELIEDRNANYDDADARTLIADNAWNAGIVTGAARSVPADLDLDGLAGRLDVNGVRKSEGPTDGPMEALAWVANLAAERGRPLKAGMVVITGSVVATLPISPGDRFVFALDGIGETEMILE